MVYAKTEFLGSFVATAIFIAVVGFGLFTAFFPSTSSEPATPPSISEIDLEAPRPIAAHESVFLEELTWMETRDLIRTGTKTILIPTGGVEQNGPYLALGKHNFVMTLMSERIARRLGNALVAPVLPYVPEGPVDPPAGHMLYPGTISLREDTFDAVLTDIAASLKAHGFERIILLGDSGGNQSGMNRVARKLSQKWAHDPARVYYIPEFYDNVRWEKWLAEKGFPQTPGGNHAGLRYTLLMLLQDPTTIRLEQRQAANDFSVNGVPLDPVEEKLALAEELVNHQVDVTVRAIRAIVGEN